MERSRESKRADSGPRRLRISCPKDLTDAEARMDDTPLIEKVKKGNLQALCASSPSTASKRRRYGFQEAHNFSEGFNCTKDVSKLTPSDDDACHGTLHSKQRAKKDELVINICNIPRRARSSATRVPFASSRQLVPTSQQRSPSTGLLFRREEKIVRQIGVKSRLLKDLEVMKSEQISDQEAEIAGLLYDLSRSLPTVVQSTSAKSEEKSCRDLEEEVFNSSSSPIAGLEKLSRSCGPLLTEQKRKRMRVFDKQEESPCMQPAERVSANTGFCVGEQHVLVEQGIQVDESLCRNGAASKLSYHQPELMTRNVIKELCFEDNKNASYTEEEMGQEPKVSEDNQTHSAGQTCKQDNLESSSPSTNKSELCGQSFCKDSNGLKNSSRSHKGSEGSGMSVSKDMWCISKHCNRNTEKINQENGVRTPIKDDHRLGTIDVPRWNQGLIKAPLSPKKGEQEVLRLLRVKNQNILMPDLCKNEETLSAGVSFLSTVHPSSNSVTTSNGRIGAVPQLGLNRKAGPLWLTNCLHSGSSSCQTVQLPHAASAQHFVRRIRRCATHVHIAHIIQQQQQFLRRPFWPAACNSLNLSLSTASLQGKLEKECFSNRTPSLQAECRHTWADNVGTRMSGTKNKICLAGYNNSAQVLSAGAGMKKGCDVSNSLLSTSQLKQSASHSSGPNTISVFEQIPGSECLFFQ